MRESSSPCSDPKIMEIFNNFITDQRCYQLKNFYYQKFYFSLFFHVDRGVFIWPLQKKLCWSFFLYIKKLIFSFFPWIKTASTKKAFILAMTGRVLLFLGKD